MCGVLLIFSKKGEALPKKKCVDASKKLFNRGPDNFKNNFLRKNTLFISNTVLSITGHEQSNQNLIRSKSKNYIISFNGEIYNYKFLSKKKNNETNSDTKVLIDLYDQMKIKNIPKLLDGMFAYVVYDKKNDSINIVNDSQGEKNLYYFEDKNFFIVSSTIEPILFFTKTKKLNDKPLKNYFFTRHYMPNHQTCFENIYLFPNSSYSFYYLNINKLKLGKYDDPIKWISEKKYKKFSNFSESEMIEYFDFHLNNQAKLMVPDRRFGCVVSGGIDSTLQAYFINKHAVSNFNLAIDHINKDPIMKKLNKFNNFFSNPINKFSINKAKYQKLITNCFKIVCSPLQTHDLPSRLLLSDIFKKNKCKVFFSADGCDELFGGQQIYKEVFKKINKVNFNYSPYSNLSNLFNLDRVNLSDDYKNLMENKWNSSLNAYNFIKSKKERNIQSYLFMDYFVQSVSVVNR